MDATGKIDQHIASYKDWRGDLLLRLRRLIGDTDPRLKEDWKWNVPVWTVDGKLVCAISAFKDHVKMNFFKGATLPDPQKVFNAGLDSKEHRSINFAETDDINEPAIKELIRAAMQH